MEHYYGMPLPEDSVLEARLNEQCNLQDVNITISLLHFDIPLQSVVEDQLLSRFHALRSKPTVVIQITVAGGKYSCSYLSKRC